MRLAFTLFGIRNIKASASVLFIVMTASAHGRKTLSVTAPPVFWNIFTAETSSNKVLLKWTVTEYNNKKFYIQTSLNGSDWKNVDSVESKKSLESIEEYSFSHVNNGEGRQYYRVKQVDIDIDKMGYSKVLTVMLKNNDQQHTITIWPNPASSEIRIINNGNDHLYVQAKVFDLSGKTVAEKKLQSHTNAIAISELPAGAYIVRLESTDGTTFQKKIIKQ
jgi:hypothetical protein